LNPLRLPSLVALPLIALISTVNLAGCAAATPDASPRAEIAAGTLEGVWIDEPDAGAIFRGVPFAAPPVGALRWRAPAPVAAWSGLREARDFEPACMQGGYIEAWYANVAESFGADRSDAPRPTGESEDCLYLNIWTPALDPEEPAPVLIYIHGGSYQGGWAYEPDYHGEAFVRNGVLVVSIAYRLGAFGYLAPEGENPNLGLMDQLAALEWVRDNIASFGGDPHRVVIAGESAGAAAVGTLLAVPAADGLIAGAISQSGGWEYNALGSAEAAREAFGRLAAELEGAPRDASAEAVLAAAGAALGDYDFGPVVDGDFLPVEPSQRLADGSLINVPLIIGTNHDEWLSYLDPDAAGADIGQWRARMGDELVDRLIAEAGEAGALDLLETAEQMRCPGYRLAEVLARQGQPVYFYRFDRVRPGEFAQSLGAYHGAELPYVFDTHAGWIPTAAEDRQLSGQMNAAWARFIRSGDPDLEGAADWPEFGATGEMLVWSDTLTVTTPGDRDICAILDEAPGE
jgi:para-nitrobenzyl esterase